MGRESTRGEGVGPILILGGTGMLGSMITDVLARDNELAVTATVRNERVLEKVCQQLPGVNWKQFDATDDNLPQTLDIVNEHTWMINAIGITKPLIHDDNPFEVERAIHINSLFPHLLAVKAKSIGAQVLQIATDCVYSGNKGHYTESDNHDAIDVYGKTKSLGEVMQPCMHHLRCSIIGPEPKDFKFLLEWFRRQPIGAQINGYINHRWNGITTLHFAKIVKGIIKTGITLPHVQHIIPTGDLTKAEMLREFARAYRRKDTYIQDTTATQEIDRTLCTSQPDFNKKLWQVAGYDKPLTVPDMITELSQYNYCFAM